MKYLNKLLLILILFVFNQNYASEEYVILISFDGFRWDYLNRGATPTLDALLKTGVRALSLRPVFPSKTFPNHISIATGLYPEHHGIIHNHFKNPATNEEYGLGDLVAKRDSKWYSGEFIWETAKMQGVITASFFWPGSEVTTEYRQPNYIIKYKHDIPYNERIQQVLDWLKLPPKKRPHLITLYFHETDTKGHEYGPDSPQVNEAIRILDKQIAELNLGLEEIGLKDSVNLIIVSDHGMTPISNERVINIEKILKDKKAESWENGSVMMLNPKEHGVYEVLKKNSQNFYVYKKNEIPEFYKYSEHPFIYPIILIAKPGYSIQRNIDKDRKKYNISGGDHGYEKDFLDMHGIFVAAGPAFKKNYKTGTLWNIDIYPLICKILNISPHQPIDGKLDRIGFVLKEQ